MKHTDFELREYPGRVPVTVQPSFVLIPNGEPHNIFVEAQPSIVYFKNPIN